jgi:hypothetical protein
MKRIFVSAACAAAALACGCAGVDTRNLRDGMSRSQVRAAIGRPDLVQVPRDRWSGAEIWVYRRHYLPGIPNPLTDYDYIIPPLGGRETRIRFVNGRLLLKGPPAGDPARAAAPARPTPPPAGGAGWEGGVFNFHGVGFGMTKDEVQAAIAKLSPAKMRASHGGEWGDYQVQNPVGKVLGLYFKFDDKGRLYWMKAEYPYSRTNPEKTAGLLRSLKAQYQAPAAKGDGDVEIAIDEAKMRMTMVSRSLRDEYRGRAPGTEGGGR